MTQEDTQQTAPRKVFSLTRGAIQAIAVGIKTECEKDDRKAPEGREMIRIAFERYRSSISNGTDDFLGTAEPLK